MPEDKTAKVPAKRSGRSWRWTYYLVVLIVIVAAALYFTGHLPGTGGKGGSTSTTAAPPVGAGYLAATSTSVIFIQWNQAGTTATGVAQIANVQGKAPSQTIAVKTTTATGQLNGSNVSVDFEGVTEGRPRGPIRSVRPSAA